MWLFYKQEDIDIRQYEVAFFKGAYGCELRVIEVSYAQKWLYTHQHILKHFKHVKRVGPSMHVNPLDCIPHNEIKWTFFKWTFLELTKATTCTRICRSWL